MYSGYVNPARNGGVFIWYLRCPLDMLSQILNYKTIDCGKLYLVTKDKKIYIPELYLRVIIN